MTATDLATSKELEISEWRPHILLRILILATSVSPIIVAIFYEVWAYQRGNWPATSSMCLATILIPISFYLALQFPWRMTTLRMSMRQFQSVLVIRSAFLAGRRAPESRCSPDGSVTLNVDADWHPLVITIRPSKGSCGPTFIRENRLRWENLAVDFSADGELASTPSLQSPP